MPSSVRTRRLQVQVSSEIQGKEMRDSIVDETWIIRVLGMVFSLNLDGSFENVKKSSFLFNDSGKDSLIFSDTKRKKIQFNRNDC